MPQLMECDCHVDVDIAIMLPKVDLILSCVSVVGIDIAVIEKKLGTMLLAYQIELLLEFLSCHHDYLHRSDENQSASSSSNEII